MQQIRVVTSFFLKGYNRDPPSTQGLSASTSVLTTLPWLDSCVHRGPEPPFLCGHRTETWTPSRPLEPLCTRTVVRGQLPHHHPPSVTAIYSRSPTFTPTTPSSSSFILLTSTPFLTHQPPSSPCSYPTALPSRSIPQAVHTEAYCACRETAEGSIQSEQRRKMMCRAKINSVFLLYTDTYL